MPASAEFASSPMRATVTPLWHQRFTVKELAAQLQRHRNYVHAMKRQGFAMVDGKASIAEARAWLARNPAPRSRYWFKAAA